MAQKRCRFSQGRRRRWQFYEPQRRREDDRRVLRRVHPVERVRAVRGDAKLDRWPRVRAVVGDGCWREGGGGGSDGQPAALMCGRITAASKRTASTVTTTNWTKIDQNRHAKHRYESLSGFSWSAHRDHRMLMIAGTDTVQISCCHTPINR